ncbi:SLAM family member 7 [Notothenia coriiceps]|uniref:SLAM family member 7 n=1 Tax=Notothenia coriiceps TaxID=8208 RepID=A0A6I9PDA5_9TELE|nr:PREDICTED: SLAM family member 7 [Notothenia coriiceps]
MNIRKVVYWSVDEMGKLVVFSLLFLASLSSASTVEKKFTKEGGSVTLDLRPAPSDPITIIQWKFKDSILAEWLKDVLPLTHNRDNIKLDIISGRLVMEKITNAEEGAYSVEINNNEQKVTYIVLVIRDVPKPVIWFSPASCSHESDECIMTCEGDTTGAEPVTYRWKTGDGEWIESGKVMPITKKEHGHVKNLFCKMNNPVSEEVSEPLPNILSKKEEPVGSPTGVIVGIIGVLLVVAAGIGCFWAWKNDKFPCVNRSTI